MFYIIIVIKSTSFSSILRYLCPYITIFARVSPAQKEAIIHALNDAGDNLLLILILLSISI